jgi:hypothetical protein
MLVEVGVQPFFAEDPTLPRLGRAGNLASPDALEQGLLMQAQVLGSGFDLKRQSATL